MNLQMQEALRLRQVLVPELPAGAVELRSNHRDLVRAAERQNLGKKPKVAVPRPVSQEEGEEEDSSQPVVETRAGLEWIEARRELQQLAQDPGMAQGNPFRLEEQAGVPEPKTKLMEGLAGRWENPIRLGLEKEYQPLPVF